jgi:hypothetical protein
MRLGPVAPNLELAIDGAAECEELSRLPHGGNDDASNILGYLLSSFDLNFVMHMRDEGEVLAPGVSKGA